MNHLPKFYKRLETYVLVNKNLCQKLFSSLESLTTSDESFKVTSVPIFIPDFNSLSCELDKFTLKISSHFILNKKKKK